MEIDRGRWVGGGGSSPQSTELMEFTHSELSERTPSPNKKIFPRKNSVLSTVQELLHFKLFIWIENRVKRRQNENTDPVKCTFFCTDELHLTFTK